MSLSSRDLKSSFQISIKSLQTVQAEGAKQGHFSCIKSVFESKREPCLQLQELLNKVSVARGNSWTVGVEMGEEEHNPNKYLHLNPVL